MRNPLLYCLRNRWRVWLIIRPTTGSILLIEGEIRYYSVNVHLHFYKRYLILIFLWLNKRIIQLSTWLLWISFLLHKLWIFIFWVFLLQTFCVYFERRYRFYHLKPKALKNAKSMFSTCRLLSCYIQGCIQVECAFKEAHLLL